MDKYDALIDEAKKCHDDGDLEKALTLYDDAFCIKTSYDDLFNYALLNLDLSNFIKAYNIFKFLYKKTKEEDSYLGIAVAISYLGKTKKAIKMCNKVLKKNKCTNALFILSKLFEDNKEIDKAINCLEEYLLLIDDNVDVYLAISNLYEEKKEYQKAINFLEKAVNLDNTISGIFYNIGVLYTMINENEKALESYLSEIKTESAYQKTYLNIGLIYKDNYNDFIKALEYYQKGLRINDKDGDLWYNSACIYALQKDYQMAKGCLRCAALIDIENISFIDEDDELKEFRKSIEYFELINEFGKKLS